MRFITIAVVWFFSVISAGTESCSYVGSDSQCDRAAVQSPCALKTGHQGICVVKSRFGGNAECGCVKQTTLPFSNDSDNECGFVGSEGPCEKVALGSSCVVPKSDRAGICAAKSWLGDKAQCRCVEPAMPTAPMKKERGSILIQIPLPIELE